jgi:hypothetical protein
VHLTRPSSAACRKNMRSGTNGCVEVAFVEGEVTVRYSKDRGGPFLIFIAHEWEALTARVRDKVFELAGWGSMGGITP